MNIHPAQRLPSAGDLLLVDRLLTMLRRRMLAALDLGLVLLLEPQRERYDRYVADHVAAPIRAAALVLRLAVAESVAEPALTPFQAVEVEAEAFVRGLESLSDFRSLPGEELDAVAARLALAFDRLTDTFLDIGERLCFEPALARELEDGRQAAARKAIEQLPATLAAECVGESYGRSGNATVTRTPPT